MSIDKIKKGDLKPYLLKALFAVVIIIALIFYFKFFLTKGIIYDDVFLKKSVISSSEINYSGISAYGNINITVKSLNKNGLFEVIYNLPNNIYEQYFVEFSNSTNGYTDKDVIIKKDDVVVFDGEYTKKSSFLIDKSGEVFFDGEMIQVSVSEMSPYSSDYKIVLKNVADVAYFANDTIVGRVELLIFAVFLFGLTLFDMRFPLFFFALKHLMDVRNPEPSDFYLFTQKTTWVLYPVIGVCLMIFAVISRFV